MLPRQQELESKTKEIKWLCQTITGNCFKIGKVLFGIRQDELYKEKYESFTDYLNSEEFSFGREYAYKLIKVFTEYQNTPKLAETLPFRRLIEIIHVPNKEVREGLIQEASEILEAAGDKAPKLEEFRKKVTRIAQRTNDIVEEGDSKKDKCLRLLNGLIFDLKEFDASRVALDSRIKDLGSMCLSFKDDENVIKLFNEVVSKWKELAGGENDI